MKNRKITKYILFTALFGLLLIGTATAQDQDQIAVPLSNPGEPGSLKLGLVRGSISITGYEGSEVIIRYGGEEDEEEREVTQDGLRRISSNASGFEVKEDDNRVEIGGVSPMKDIYFDISVPRNFSLKLSSVHGDDMRVENVNGEMEISHVNGDVFLINVGGSAVVNTVHGDITATFNRVTEGKPMAFSNVNGDIDITLPAGARLTAKMKSEWGEVFTDFEMDIQRSEDERVNTSESGVYKVSVNNWINGTINGGGPEYLFKTLQGDIYIRRNRNQ